MKRRGFESSHTTSRTFRAKSATLECLKKNEDEVDGEDFAGVYAVQNDSKSSPDLFSNTLPQTAKFLVLNNRSAAEGSV